MAVPLTEDISKGAFQFETRLWMPGRTSSGPLDVYVWNSGEISWLYDVWAHVPQICNWTHGVDR